jgi:hypothetical protein
VEEVDIKECKGEDKLGSWSGEPLGVVVCVEL